MGDEGVKTKSQTMLVDAQVFAAQDEGSSPSASTLFDSDAALTKSGVACFLQPAPGPSEAGYGCPQNHLAFITLCVLQCV